jgi:hypothetical protein
MVPGTSYRGAGAWRVNYRGPANALAKFLFLGCVVAIVSAPLAGVWSIKHVRFSDRLGSVPVEVSLSHNGESTLDAGILGRVYWDRTGTAGFGAYIRATAPPQAGGSLASYVDPHFIQANAELIGDPGALASAYGSELRSALVRTFASVELGVAAIGGLILLFASRRRRWGETIQPAAGLAVAVGLIVSQLIASCLLAAWDGSARITETHRLREIHGLSFSSPEVLEIAQQVRPFLEKNAKRIEADAAQYQDTADASLQEEIPEHVGDLQPREGETVVVAEADPQGSLVGTRVRSALYRTLVSMFGAKAFSLRTISGDVSSNGTVGERGFVEREAHASPRIPTVAAKGDHDTDVTVKQLEGNGVTVPGGSVAEIRGLRVTAANDPAFKTLMGGMVVNHTGISEREIGVMLRAETSGSMRDTPRVVLLHQPRSAAGYIGIRSLRTLTRVDRSLTVPFDDGIPDMPPGVINVGHLHDPAGPWVIWNTDGDQVTWTVVNQLGTAGGVDETPTFNRFSTPYSTPLKDLSVQLQFIRRDSGLQAGYTDITFAVDGTVVISERTDVGLPDGEPTSTVGVNAS